MARKKIPELLDIIMAWCRENKCKYGDYQQMETLGYVKAIREPNKGWSIMIKDFVKFNRFLGRTH